MNLQQLEYFLASAERGSFSAAAEALHLSQPSVSEQVRRLEAELGVALFARVGPRPRADRGGPHAAPARRGGARARCRRRASPSLAVRELRGGTVSFGTFSTARDYLGSDLVTEFRRRHPHVRVRILGLNSAEAAQDVRDGRLEAAIVALPVDDEGLDVRRGRRRRALLREHRPAPPAQADDDRAAQRAAARPRRRELPPAGPDAPPHRRARAARRGHARARRRRRDRRDRARPRRRGRRRHDPRARPARRARRAACRSGSAGSRSPTRS